jgi:membrane protease YdiL (CAAX protease family)
MRDSLPVVALGELAGIALALRLASAFGTAWLPPVSLAIVLFAYVPMFHYRNSGWPAWAGVSFDRRRALPTLAGTALFGVAAYLAWVHLPLPEALKPGPAPTLPHPLAFVLQQAAVAASEEIFFRGYLYDAFGRDGRKALAWTSVLFAATHLAILPTAWRALTVFPALLFGWTRARTGTVWVPAALHLAFNLLPAFLGGG